MTGATARSRSTAAGRLDSFLHTLTPMPTNRYLNARLLATVLLLTAPFMGRAQGLPPPAPQNVLQLAATGTVEVRQDLLSVALTTTREGADPAAVQEELKKALESALAAARAAAQPGQMDVRTGQFGLWPRHTPEGRISGWHGTAELVLEGRDFARIAQTSARIATLTVGRVGYDLSREQRSRVEREAQAIAIERFKAKAADLAREFGFSGYGLREVAVNLNDQVFVPRRSAMATAAMAEAKGAMPLPVEAGKASVTVTVSGSVQLR